MDDLIKRSEAIDAIRQWVKMHKYYHPHSKGKTIPVDEAIDELERAQAEQETGKWIAGYDLIIAGHCSLCGWNAIRGETDVLGMPYCPNCGSKMERE